MEFGRSLLVPCVQELAKGSLTEVPTRYILPNNDHPITTDGPCPDLPVIDMMGLLSEDVQELKKLDSACRHWGFFQLINHGVNHTLLEKIKMEIVEFFNLPMEEKKMYWQSPGDVEGFGQAFVMSEEQSLDWGDMFFLKTLPPHHRKPHLFPKLPLPFRNDLEAYAIELKQLALKVLNFMAKALGMSVQDMKDLFEEGTQSMRMNYYPPCPQPEKVIGLAPHSDGVGLTILLQISEVEGLQIRKNGIWVPVKPLPDAFIVNIGDMLEMVTNGAYRSIEHRAVVNSNKERLSVATFYSPEFDGELGPAPSLIGPQTPALYKRISVEEFIKGLFTRKLDGKAYLDDMKIQNENQEI